MPLFFLMVVTATPTCGGDIGENYSGRQTSSTTNCVTDQDCVFSSQVAENAAALDIGVSTTLRLI
jgi:hypothetical protein